MKPIFVVPMCLMTLACNPMVSNDEQLFREKGFEYTNQPTTHSYTDAIDYGLRILKPYSNPDDVCGVVDKTSLPTELAAKYGQLIACPKHEKGALGDRIREGAIVVAHAKHWTVLKVSKTPKPKKKTADNQSQKIGNSTIISYDDFHGTQIEYRDPQGGAWLVYPNNRSVLPGRWKLDDDQRLCHKYFSSGINPATGVVGYEWECASKVYEHVSTKDYKILLGDPFKLYRRAGRIPSGDLKRQVSLGELRQLFNPE